MGDGVSVTTNTGGTTSIGGNVTTTGAQTYSDAVTLAAATALTGSGGVAITLGSTVNGAFTLAVNTTGATTFAGAVGRRGERDDRRGGTTSIGGNVTTTGAQTYSDAVTLDRERDTDGERWRSSPSRARAQPDAELLGGGPGGRGELPGDAEPAGNGVGTTKLTGSQATTEPRPTATR